MPQSHNVLDNYRLEDTLLLKGVDLESIRDLLQDCPIQELKEGEVLLSAGQPNHLLYLLLSGRLRIHLKLTMGPLAVVEPGDFVGELSVIDGQPASAYVVGAEICHLLALDEKTIWTLIETAHPVARNLLLVLSRRLRQGNSLFSAVEQCSEEELSRFDPDDVPASEKGLLREFKTHAPTPTIKLSGPPQESVPESVRDIVEEFSARISSDPAAANQQREADKPESQLVDRGSQGKEELEPGWIYAAGQAFIFESISRVKDNGLPHIQQGTRLVNLMIDSLARESDLLLLATDRRQNFSVGNHCVNVAILGLRIAQTLKYQRQRQIRAGLAALLHEIGVAKLANRMGNPHGQESSEAKQRPVYGADILKKLGPEFDWLAETVAQVFERENGTGSPLGLRGKEIHEEAKILGVADVFEACIHDRSHRKALTGYQFVHELTSSETKTFSDRIVKAVLDGFSPYPYNEYVILNTDEVGRVVEVNPKNLFNPLIEILYNSAGESLNQPRKTDLAQFPTVYITKAINYEMLPASP